MKLEAPTLKFVLRCIVGVAVAVCVALTAHASQGPSLLFDARTGEVLAQDRAGEPWYPASLTKLMTGYIVFQKLKAGALKRDQQIPVSKRASSQEPSKIGIPEGKTVSVDFALQAMLVYSANDMAYVLAEASSGSIEKFADEMNATAHHLGLTASHFVNPNGLFDPRQVTSARDIGVLAAIIVAEFPEYSHYFTQSNVVVGKRKLANRNMLIRTMPEADGMKTGFVCNSGFNLVASATRAGRRLIAVVMGEKSGFARAEAARKMLEEGFAKTVPVAAPKAADIVNLPQGAIVPTDMTTVVCKKKAPVTVKDGTVLAGWAASLGTYDTALKADMALRGRLLSPVGINVKGSTGVIDMPGKAHFAALVWNLDKSTSLALCKGYRDEGAQCAVMPPALMEQIASTAKAQKAVASTVAQGSDSGEQGLPAKSKKRMRRMSH